MSPRATSITMLLIAALAGCAGPLHGAKSYAEESARYRNARAYDTVAINVVPGPVDINATGGELQKATSALTGVAAVGYCSEVAPLLATGAGALFAIPCLGLVVAAANEASQIPSGKENARSGALVTTIAGESVESRLRKSLQKYASAEGIPLTDGSDSCTPGSSSNRSAVLRVTPQRFSVTGLARSDTTATLRFVLHAELEYPCGTRIDTFNHAVGMDFDMRRGELVEPLEILQRRFDDALRETASDIVDEALLIWHPPWPPETPDAEAQTPPSKRISLVALEPLQPAVSLGAWKQFGMLLKHPNKAANGGLFVKPATNPPVFRWESVSDLVAARAGNGPPLHIENVSYEFVLYDFAGAGAAASPASTVAPAEMEILRSRAELYHVVDLQAPEFTPPGALESCRVYAWTVRAHLWVDGSPRVTEWAGLPNQAFGFAPPWRYRRDEAATNGVANPTMNHFVFRTPPPPGFRSCED